MKSREGFFRSVKGSRSVTGLLQGVQVGSWVQGLRFRGLGFRVQGLPIEAVEAQHLKC